MSASVVDDVRLSAYNREPNPDESWGLPELVLWYSFRELYRDFRDEKFDKRTAEQMKSSLLKRYQEQKAKYDIMQNIVRHQAEMYRQIELAGNRYGTDRTLENADAFMEAVYGVQNGQRMSADDSAV